jgi:CelD/BcsL family acetyltransferase involved in cellulose biosynthesis
MTCHVEIIRELGPFRSLEDEYRLLLEECDAANAFLTWEWLTTWLEVFGHTCTLLVVIVRDERGQLVGVGPFKVTRRFRCGLSLRQLELIGTGEAVKPDCLDLLIRRGHEADVSRQIAARVMATRKEWDVLAVTGLVDDSATLQILNACARRATLPHHSRPDRICPYVQLPEKWSELEARLGKSFSRHLKRGTRRLFDELGVTFELLTEPSSEDVEEAIADLARLHQDRMEKTDRGGNFRKSDYYAFHLAFAKRLALKRELVLAFLRHGTLRIAARYGFVYGRTYYAYQSGFDRRYEQHSPSTVLLSCLIRHFIDSRYTEFNFLRGDQPHKYEWTNLDRRTNRFYAWSGPRGYWLWMNAVLRANGKLASGWWRSLSAQLSRRGSISRDHHQRVGGVGDVS